MIKVALPHAHARHATGEEHAAAVARAVPHGCASRVVLAVDDEPFFCELQADILLAAGFVPVTAASPDEAIACLALRTDIAAIWTDIEMGTALSGIDLARLVHDHYPDIRLMITSARKAPSPAELPNGAVFLAKPYRPPVVVEHLRRLLAP